MEYPIIHNPEMERFELSIEGKLALVEYRGTSNRIAFTHTEVPVGLEGRGIGKALARHVLAYARREGKTVIPLCPFIHAFVRRHPDEYGDIIAEGYLD